MMNKSLRAPGRESSDKEKYGFRPVRRTAERRQQSASNAPRRAASQSAGDSKKRAAGDRRL